jgi:hypothetical protein
MILWFALFSTAQKLITVTEFKYQLNLINQTKSMDWIPYLKLRYYQLY